MGAPAYTRLENDERRRRLLELGARLFTEHAYDEISMARIAREAGISKALLYHYFPSKQEYFMATLAGGAEELRARIEPDPALPPAQALTDALDAYLGWIEDNADAYAKLFRSAAGVPEVRELVDGVRPGRRSGSSTASAPRRTRERARPCTGGCGSWTARAWTGSRTAICHAPSCTACCWGRSPER